MWYSRVMEWFRRIVEQIENLLKGIINFFISIFVFCLIIWSIWWVFDSVKSWYYNREQPPFWDGTDRLQVCKKPYYSSDDCYFLPVTLIDDNKARISFNDGGVIYTQNLTCYYAAEMYGKDRYKFCRSWDSIGQQWDFMPSSVIY
jgi:hypothetical protein